MLKRFEISSEREDYITIHDTVENGIEFKGTNLWILIFAIFIASVGLNVNSTAMIIGAMLVWQRAQTPRDPRNASQVTSFSLRVVGCLL